MGNRGSQLGGGGSDGDSDLELFRERLLDHPDDEVTTNDNRSRATGNSLIMQGLSLGQGLTIAGIACFALGSSIVNIIQSSQDRADMRSRYEESYRELATKTALVERRYIDMESYALLNGWKVPKDDQHGPLGNLDRLKGENK